MDYHRIDGNPFHRRGDVSSRAFIRHEHFINLNKDRERHPQACTPPVRIVPPYDHTCIGGSVVPEQVGQIGRKAGEVFVGIGGEAKYEIEVEGVGPTFRTA